MAASSDCSSIATTQVIPNATTISNNHDKSTKDAKPKSVKALEWLRWFLCDQWFLIAMAAVILLASQVQVPASRQRTKRTVITYLSVSVIFFINGCTLETSILLANSMRWKLHAFVQLQCYLVCSAATFAIVSLCATNPDFMDPWLLIGFLFVGSAPTTMNSNVVMTRQAHGNTALTVVQSVIGQFLCPFLTPIILQMYLSSGAWYSKVLVHGDGDGYGEMYRRVFMQLGLSLFVPMFLGQVVQKLFPKQTKKVFFAWKMIKLSQIALLTLIWQTFDQAFQSGAFNTVKPSNIAFIVFITIALYMIWLATCFSASIIWLPKKDVIACCYCCPAKALAMVVPLSSVMYINTSPVEQSKLQIPAIIFQAFQVAIGGIMTIVFRKWIRPEEQMEEAGKSAEARQGRTNVLVFNLSCSSPPGIMYARIQNALNANHPVPCTNSRVRLSMPRSSSSHWGSGIVSMNNSLDSFETLTWALDARERGDGVAFCADLLADLLED